MTYNKDIHQPAPLHSCPLPNDDELAEKIHDRNLRDARSVWNKLRAMFQRKPEVADLDDQLLEDIGLSPTGLTPSIPEDDQPPRHLTG